MKENRFYFIKIGPLVRILEKHELFMDYYSKYQLIIDWRDDID